MWILGTDWTHILRKSSKRSLLRSHLWPQYPLLKSILRTTSLAINQDWQEPVWRSQLGLETPPERTHQTLLNPSKGPPGTLRASLSSYLLLAGELHLPLGDLTAEMVHLASQLHDLIIGTGSLVKLFGQIEVLVVEFSIVLSQLVQLLLQVGDDLWGGCGRGVIYQKRVTVTKEMLLEPVALKAAVGQRHMAWQWEPACSYLTWCSARAPSPAHWLQHVHWGEVPPPSLTCGTSGKHSKSQSTKC